MSPSKPTSLGKPNSRLQVRNARHQDIPEIADLTSRAYAGTGMFGYSQGALKGQLNSFPEGQFVVLADDKLVGYCATFRISEAVGLSAHTWTEITGNGYASRHDPEGDWLYGM